MKWFAMYNVTPVGLVLKMVIGGNKNLFIKNDKNFDLREIKAKKFKLNQEQNDALKFLKKKIIDSMFLSFKEQLVQVKHLYILRE